MVDKTAVGISDALRQCLEAIAEDVILGGGTFEGQKKYLRRYCEVESIDYNNLEKALLSLFDSASSYKESGAKSSEQSIRISAQDCYLSEEAIQKLISSLKAFRAKEEAKRKKKEQAEKKAKEDAERKKKREEAERIEKEAAERKKREEQERLEKKKRCADNRELLLKDAWFNSFPVIRDELLTIVDREDFYNAYFWGYQANLKELQNTIKKIRDGLSDDVAKQSSNYQAFSLSAKHYLDKAPTLHCSELKSAQDEGKKLLERIVQLRSRVLHEKRIKEREIKQSRRRKRKKHALVILGIVLFLITCWIFSRDSALWKRVLFEVWFLIMFGGGGVMAINAIYEDDD